MRCTSTLVSSISCLALLSQTVIACTSYGMDFQDGGSYFQNSLSSDPFTFVSQFSGCNNDTAYNLLVDPDGYQHECTNTQLQPDDTDEMSTCPLNKNQLTSGQWSVIIISNNGDGGDPIGYERDFSLSVGPQLTTTVTPTVTVWVSTTTVATVTSTSTDVICTELPTQTTTMPSTTITPTVTSTPSRVLTTITTTPFTVTNTKVSLSISKATHVVTASCKLPTRASTHDPTCRIQPTVGPAASIPNVPGSKNPSGKFRLVRDRAIHKFSLDTYLEERRQRLESERGLERRAPDPQPLTVTEPNVSAWPTVTSTTVVCTSTLVDLAYTTSTSTITPVPVTVLKGKTKAPRVTVTAPTPTKTKTKRVVAKTTVTQSVTSTVTITSKTTPAAVKTACRKAGGILV